MGSNKRGTHHQHSRVGEGFFSHLHVPECKVNWRCSRNITWGARKLGLDLFGGNKRIPYGSFAGNSPDVKIKIVAMRNPVSLTVIR